MQIKANFTVLKAFANSFEDKAGKTVEYGNITGLLEGKDLIVIKCPKKTAEDLKGNENVAGTATLEVKPNFKNEAKVVLVDFKKN